MSELANGFDSLPAEYKEVLHLAQDKHRIQVTPLQMLSGGRTGAYLYLVSVSSAETAQVKHLVLKLDHKNKKSKLDEIQRHSTAVSQAPPEFANKHLADLAFDRIELNEAVAIFYEIAGQSLHHYKSLADYQEQSNLEKMFSMTNEVLLAQWNRELTFEQAIHPQALLARWLGYRLRPGGNIEHFLEDACRIPQKTTGLLIQGHIFPNPLIFARESEIWSGIRPIDIIVGFQHGDLNIGNILVKFGEKEKELTGYYLIDFALFKTQMPLLYDQCYLEMSYLIREVSRVGLPKWVDLVSRFAEADRIDPHQVPIELAGACAVINSGRKAFGEWVQASYPSLSDDLWGQFWLAAAAAGLNYCNKPAIPEKERLAGLIFAAAHLKRYHTTFGVPLPVEVKHIDIDGMPAESPVAASVNRISAVGLYHNLPARLTPFIGRRIEVSAARELLLGEDVRLLTMTGAGGTGKTRLALEAVGDMHNFFTWGIYFVDLAPIREPESVPAAIARAVGLRETSDGSLRHELKKQLQDKQLLLLLDNFEQVTSAAPVVAELLQDCPQVKMLVTSREALQVRGERVFPVPPLTLPDATFKQLSPEQLAQFDSVQLFAERAVAVSPDFEITKENAPTVAKICTRLDGLPLAIELAAARIKLFSPRALLDRLGGGLKLLRGGAHDLPVRQQTLRDTIDWSYNLLDAGEQRLFALLSVFHSCTFESVEGVFGSSKWLGDIDIVDGLSSLLDKSLIRRVDQDSGEPRLRMLETLREYASERLAEDSELIAEAQKEHAVWFADYTQRQYARLAGAAREAALVEINPEIENMRIAWRYWVAHKDLEQLHKLTNCLWLLYDARGWHSATVELTADLLNVLASTPSTPERARQEIMLQTSLARVLIAIKGCVPEVEGAYKHALDLCEKYGEIPQSFPVLKALASYYAYVADFEKATHFGEKILALADQLNDANGRVDGHLIIGYCTALSGKPIQGLEHLEKAIAIYDPDTLGSHGFRFGNNPGVTCYTSSAIVLWMLGFPDHSKKHADEALALANKINHPFSMAYAMFHTGLLRLWEREAEIARERAQATLVIAEKYEFPVWKAVALCLHGAATSAMGRAEEGLEEINQGLDMYSELKTPPVFWPLLLLLRTNSYILAAQPGEALKIADEALEIIGKSSDNPLLSELYRLKGDALLMASSEKMFEAESLFQQAADIAEKCQTKMFELKVAMSLSRLWQEQGESEKGRRFLSKVYDKFTEGLTTADLTEARELIADLSQRDRV